MHASVGLRRRSRTSGADVSKRLALEEAVESLAAPHERAAAAAPAHGKDAAFQFGLAKGPRRLEAAVGGRLARCEERLAPGRVDERVRVCLFVSHELVQSGSVSFRRRRADPARNRRSERLSDDLARAGVVACATLGAPEHSTTARRTIRYVAPTNLAHGIPRRGGAS
jgi:hypothetical protein